jgi:hypothetical protein
MTAPGVFYAIRQARTRVIGSELMTAAEADREVTCWRDHIGPARAVPATKAMRHAVRYYDQDILVPVLAGGEVPS